MKIHPNLNPGFSPANLSELWRLPRITNFFVESMVLSELLFPMFPDFFVLLLEFFSSSCFIFPSQYWPTLSSRTIDLRSFVFTQIPLATMANNDSKALDLVASHDEFSKSSFGHMAMDDSQNGVDIGKIRRKVDWQIVPLMCMLAYSDCRTLPSLC